MIKVNITRILLNENNRIAHEWFEIGAHARWTDSRETKELKKLEQQAMEYNYQTMYESQMVIV